MLLTVNVAVVPACGGFEVLKLNVTPSAFSFTSDVVTVTVVVSIAPISVTFAVAVAPATEVSS